MAKLLLGFLFGMFGAQSGSNTDCVPNGSMYSNDIVPCEAQEQTRPNDDELYRNIRTGKPFGFDRRTDREEYIRRATE